MATDKATKVRCKHCGSTKLRLSHRQYIQGESDRVDHTGGVRVEQVMTVILRCTKCDLFTSVRP